MLDFEIDLNFVSDGEACETPTFPHLEVVEKRSWILSFRGDSMALSVSFHF